MPFSCMSESNKSDANFFQFGRHILALPLTHDITNCWEEIKHIYFLDKIILCVAKLGPDIASVTI